MISVFILPALIEMPLAKIGVNMLLPCTLGLDYYVAPRWTVGEKHLHLQHHHWLWERVMGIEQHD